MRPVPGGYEDILIGPNYALTAAVTDTGYYAVVELASGVVHKYPVT